MNISGLYVVLLIAVAMVIIMIATAYNAKKRLREEIVDAFGTVPESLHSQIESIGDYHYYHTMYATCKTLIDDTTWNDLDMDKIFKRINACQSSVGEEYLYSILHEIKFDKNHFLKREAFLSYLDTHSEERIKIQVILAELGKAEYNGLPLLIFESEGKALKNSWIYNVLGIFPVLCLVLAIFNLGTGVLGFLGACVLNGFIYYQIKRHIMTDLASMQYVSSMLRCCDKICSIKMSCEESEIQTLKQYYQVFRSLRGKIPNTFKTSFSDADFLGEYTKIIFMSDLRHYNAAIKKITAHKEEFHALYRQLGEIDMAISLLSFRKSIPFYTKPVFTENNEIIFEELYHPLLEKPVTNNGHIDKDSIVTGSNASGKSTFIKALAVNGILAQTLYTCMAKKFVLQNSLIVTSMAVKDDITAGDSYFITEIKSLKRILDCTAEIHCNCFIDEILKGTNTIERIAASAAVMRYLHETNCLCMVASHDIELTELLKSDYANYHFSEQITNEGITFDYQLKKGPSITRNAIKLLDYMAFDEKIVGEAERMVEDFMETRIWK